MGPGGSSRAVEGALANLLNSAQLVQCEREGVDRIIDERRGGVQVAVDVEVRFAASLHHGVVHYAVEHVLHLWFVHVDHPEVGEVGASVLEIIEVDGVDIEAGEEEVVSLADEADLLALLQHLCEDLLLAVQHDEA